MCLSSIFSQYAFLEFESPDAVDTAAALDGIGLRITFVFVLLLIKSVF